MAQEAEALREKRARIIKAEAEMEAAQRLRDAALVIMDNPAGLELRRTFGIRLDVPRLRRKDEPQKGLRGLKAGWLKK